MFKKLAFLAILVVVLAAAYGAAASIGVNGGAIQYGFDADLRCDDYVGVAGWGLETDDDSVRNVRIGDVSSACAGNTLFAQILNGSTVLKSGSVVIGPGGGEVKISFNAPYPKAADITQLKIWVEGAAAP